MKTRRPWLILVVALLPALLLLAGAEFGLRWYRGHSLRAQVKENQFWNASVVIHRKSADPMLVYELVPGSEAVREGVKVTINSAGFRDDEFPNPVASRSRRILLLGDSIAWGWGVAMEKVFPQVLEKLLREKERAGEAPTIVYNFGVDGYSTEQELRLLQTRGYALEPDLIVILYALNDPDTNDGGLSRYYTRKQRFELLQLAKNAYWQLKRIGRDDPEVTRGEYHQYVHSFYRDRVEDQFRRLGRLRSDHGIPIVVAVSPVFKFEPGAPYYLQNIHDSLGELCRKNGLGFVDLYESFDGRSSQEVSLNRWHPNEEGHAVFAQTLFSYVSDFPKKN